VTNNVLDLADQFVFFGEQATGTTSVIQVVWTYDRGVDMAGLRRFHQHLLRGRLSRRIEQSPLPIGRHRWVAPGDGSELAVDETPRPRAEFNQWLREQAAMPLDAAHGPGWRLAALTFADGGTGLSLVISHTLTDGGGLCLALADATAGRDDEIGWPEAGSRRRWQAVLADARQFLRDVPGIGRAAGAAARMIRAGHPATAPATERRAPVADEPVTVPMATVAVAIDQWDARARAAGATSNSLLVGVATRLAQRLDRVAADGTVDLTMPVNDRAEGDTRANAITNVDFALQPPACTTDLRGIRSDVKAALIRHQEQPNARWALLPLIPLLPKWLLKRMLRVSVGSATSVVSSNLGDLDAAVNRPDGTDADTFFIRSLAPGVTTETLHRLGGMLVVLSGRVGRRIFVSVLSYQLAQPNSDELLRDAVAATFADFALTPIAGGTTREPSDALR
jgi:diacylglycerol O-acyltransferase / wax synthase